MTMQDLRKRPNVLPMLAGLALALLFPAQLIAEHSASLSSPQASVAKPWQDLNPDRLQLRSEAALVTDGQGQIVFAKQADAPRPIASITKLMTAMVILDAGLKMQESITINKDDRDLVQLTASRLEYGATLPREQMLQLALMASENRAASVLARTYPGGSTAFVAAMNSKAKKLGMLHSHFTDAAGLQPSNVASARDLATLVQAARHYPLIRKATTTATLDVHPYKRRGPLHYTNTNRLLNSKDWDIKLSKTGYLNEAGRCLAMQVDIADQKLVIVLLNAYGKLTPFGDSNRIRKWIEQGRKS
jgi:D-alanyl-D-alanine endopeptidase (penicillin-binding protein 7)